MKVLTIKEPYATFIMQGLKKQKPVVRTQSIGEKYIYMPENQKTLLKK